MCNNCGVLCEAFPISDDASLSFYRGKGCTIIVGDLYITNLPLSIFRAILLTAIGSVREIRGTVFMLDNAYIPAMTFFSELQSLRGVVYRNNPSLTDARLVKLERLDTAPVIIGCDRLCPARYTRVGPASSTSTEECTDPIFRYYFFIPGSFQLADIERPLLSIMRRVFDNVTNNEVCAFSGSLLL